MRKKFGIARRYSAVFASAAMTLGLLVACTGDDSEAEEQPPAGVLNICRHWSQDEFDEKAGEAEDIYGFRDAAVFAYHAARCSNKDVGFTIGISEYSQVKYADNSNAPAWEHPEALASVFNDYLEAEGLLSGWAVLSQDEEAQTKGDGDWVHLESEQELIGIGLAEVTDPDREAGLGGDYIDQLRELGGKKIQLRTYEFDVAYYTQWTDEWNLVEEGPAVYGWAVLAPLLRFGEFHEDFLVPVATDIVKFDQERDGEWVVEGEEWVSFDPLALEATDGMEPVLEALSRNLEAAEQVAEATGDPRVEALLEEG
ncbi:MAG: hypothetical protein ACRDXX_03465 [Stackebrandtia sp.]